MLAFVICGYCVIQQTFVMEFVSNNCRWASHHKINSHCSGILLFASLLCSIQTIPSSCYLMQDQKLTLGVYCSTHHRKWLTAQLLSSVQYSSSIELTPLHCCLSRYTVLLISSVEQQHHRQQSRTYCTSLQWWSVVVIAIVTVNGIMWYTVALYSCRRSCCVVSSLAFFAKHCVCWGSSLMKHSLCENVVIMGNVGSYRLLKQCIRSCRLFMLICLHCSALGYAALLSLSMFIAAMYWFTFK
jgi:hypothetical protein